MGLGHIVIFLRRISGLVGAIGALLQCTFLDTFQELYEDLNSGFI